MVSKPAGFDAEKQTYEVTATASGSVDSDEYPKPTLEEQSTLRKVADNLPIVSYSLCLVEFAERASYFGSQTVFSNFIEFPLPKGILDITKTWANELADGSLQAGMVRVLHRVVRRRLLEGWEWACRPVLDWCYCSPFWLIYFQFWEDGRAAPFSLGCNGCRRFLVLMLAGGPMFMSVDIRPFV